MVAISIQLAKNISDKSSSNSTTQQYPKTKAGQLMLYQEHKKEIDEFNATKEEADKIRSTKFVDQEIEKPYVERVHRNFVDKYGNISNNWYKLSDRQREDYLRYANPRDIIGFNRTKKEIDTFTFDDYKTEYAKLDPKIKRFFASPEEITAEQNRLKGIQQGYMDTEIKSAEARYLSDQARYKSFQEYLNNYKYSNDAKTKANQLQSNRDREHDYEWDVDEARNYLEYLKEQASKIQEGYQYADLRSYASQKANYDRSRWEANYKNQKLAQQIIADPTKKAQIEQLIGKIQPNANAIDIINKYNNQVSYVNNLVNWGNRVGFDKLPTYAQNIVNPQMAKFMQENPTEKLIFNGNQITGVQSGKFQQSMNINAYNNKINEYNKNSSSPTGYSDSLGQPMSVDPNKALNNATSYTDYGTSISNRTTSGYSNISSNTNLDNKSYTPTLTYEEYKAPDWNWGQLDPLPRLAYETGQWKSAGETANFRNQGTFWTNAKQLGAGFIDTTVIPIGNLVRHPIKSITGIYNLITHPSEIAKMGEELGMDIRNNPAYVAGEIAGILVPLKAGKIADVAKNTYVKIGTETIPATEVFDTAVLKGESTFPKSAGITTDIREFQTSTEGGKLIGTSAMDIKPKTTGNVPIKAGFKGSTNLEDAGMWITPEGRTSSWFLGVNQGEKTAYSLNPFANWGVNPNIVRVTYKDISEIPANIQKTAIELYKQNKQAGYQYINNWYKTEAEKGVAYIPLRTIMGETSEIQALIPEGNYYRVNLGADASPFSQFKGYTKSTEFGGKAVPIRDVELITADQIKSGDTVISQADVNREIQRATDYYSSGGATTTYKTPADLIPYYNTAGQYPIGSGITTWIKEPYYEVPSTATPSTTYTYPDYQKPTTYSTYNYLETKYKYTPKYPTGETPSYIEPNLTKPPYEYPTKTPNQNYKRQQELKKIQQKAEEIDEAYAPVYIDEYGNMIQGKIFGSIGEAQAEGFENIEATDLNKFTIKKLYKNKLLKNVRQGTNLPSWRFYRQGNVYIERKPKNSGGNFNIMPYVYGR